MQERCTFEYAIIRIVPKVEREEFFNVGVILYSKRRKFLDLKYEISKEKLAAFSCEIKLETFEKYLEAWKLICDGDSSAGKIGKLDQADRFRWLAASRSTVIQSSQTHIGFDVDPEKALEEIFKLHVL